MTKRYVNLKTTVGRILSFNRKEIEVSIPTFDGPWKNYHAEVSDVVTYLAKLSESDTLSYLLILESVNGNIKDIVKYIRPASPIDLMGHLMSFGLYLIRVGRKRLSLLPYNEYQKLYEKSLRLVDNFCRSLLIIPIYGTQIIFSKHIFHRTFGG